jgi:hypothetical protein
MSFNDRERSLENKYVQDEEYRFRVNAKAIRLLGLWAAGQLGMAEDSAAVYADTIVDADFESGGIKDVMAKLAKDFADKSLGITDHHLENQFKVHLAEARKALG